MDRSDRNRRTVKENGYTLHRFPELCIESGSTAGRGPEKEKGGYSANPERGMGPLVKGSVITGSDGQLETDPPLQEKVKEIEEKAYDEGFSQGEKVGMETWKEKLEPVINNFRQALGELEDIRTRIYKNAEKEAVELALAIARKIVYREVATNKEIVANVVKEALKKAGNQGGIRVRVHPSDMSYIKNSDIGFSGLVDKAENVTLIEDDKIENGGCVVETDLGEIDARIRKQLEVVEEVFRSEYQKAELRP